MKCIRKLYIFFKKKFEKRLTTEPTPFNRTLAPNYPHFKVKTKYNRKY